MKPRIGLLLFAAVCIQIVYASPVWLDEFISQTSRWEWSYISGTGFRRLTTINGSSVVEFGITNRSTSSAYSDCSLHESSTTHSQGYLEMRLRTTDDNGISQSGQGTRGWGFWDANMQNQSAAWFFSASPESDSSLRGLQTQVVKNSQVVFSTKLSSIDMREWHVYGVELLQDGSKFYVDDIEVASSAQRPNTNQRVEIWLDNYRVTFTNGIPQLGYLQVHQDEKIYLDSVSYYNTRPTLATPRNLTTDP